MKIYRVLRGNFFRVDVSPNFVIPCPIMAGIVLMRGWLDLVDSMVKDGIRFVDVFHIGIVCF